MNVYIVGGVLIGMSKKPDLERMQGMSNADFVKWARKKKEELMAPGVEEYEKWEGLAEVFRGLAEGYEDFGTASGKVKAKHEYVRAGQAYEKTGDPKLAAQMYHRAGLSGKAEEIETQMRERRRDFFKELGMPASAVFLVVGLFFLSSNFTGYSVLELGGSGSNVLGSLLIVGGVIGFWFLSRKSN